MPTFSDEAMSHAENVLQKVHDEWMQRSGVTAVDLGFKWSHGKMTDRLAIRVHVNKKRPLSEIDEAERFPEEVDGVPVDVIEATYGLQAASPISQLEAAKDNRNQRFEQIPFGVSIGSPHITAGTLGAKVFDAETGAAMILSNWHVLAGIPTATSGLPIWQPGPADGGRSDANTIAHLGRFVLGPHDAAVAFISDDRPILDETIEGEMIEDVVAPRLGMRLWKSGRTTGRTEGFIDGVRMTVTMNYGAAGARLMRDVVHIVPVPGAPPTEISAGGDSGSVWVDRESGKAVGLHFAGEISNNPEHALANEIISVIEQLDVKFPNQVVPVPPPVSEPEPPAEPSPAPQPDPTPAPDPDPDPVIPAPDPPPPTDTPKLSIWQRLWRWLRGLFR